MNQIEYDSDDPESNSGETDPPQKRRKLLHDKLVNSLDASLDMDNYDVFKIPVERKEVS